MCNRLNDLKEKQEGDAQRPMSQSIAGKSINRKGKLKLERKGKQKTRIQRQIKRLISLVLALQYASVSPRSICF